MLAVAGVFAQDHEGLKKHPQPKVAATNAPVTQAEARATFIKAETVLRGALGMPASSPHVSIPDSDKPVGRDAVVAEMVRFIAVFKPKVKMTPSPVTFDARRLQMNGPQRSNLALLVRKGAVAPVGPLATSKENTLTVPQFGDAIGFLMARIAQMTHLPSSKWTPYLRPEGEG
ncbi:hypothetical protein OP10G_4263 [Fimbriimonas ginsengisoli Gsoil 348]|uniref:Uncharacterized protein n=1 Tax=Fimbriimonas ginsengisoli Gsoil 348 TaxID=661478 RepID=A0A068NW18_FIMGI|nr:hypothetical protein OP10G_4263 [Fimbriimonas ginsengisoli Gsoil 348]